MSFIAQYILGLLVVACMLFGLYGVFRALARGRLVASTERRLLSVVETLFLPQNSTLHIVKVGARYYLIGSGAGHVSALAEVPGESIEPWLSDQRDLLKTQAQSLRGLLAHLRKPNVRS